MIKLCICSKGWRPNLFQCLDSWKHDMDIVMGGGLLEGHQALFERNTEPILGFVHDDVIVQEPWLERVEREFDDPAVGVVGFAGALGLGADQIGKIPWAIEQMGRCIAFLSNLKDAENHGLRFTGERDVAVLDSLVMFIRRELLVKASGWPIGSPIRYWCKDYFIACEAKRHGYRTRLVGMACEHLASQSFTLGTDPYGGMEENRWIFDTYKYVLPIRVDV